MAISVVYTPPAMTLAQYERIMAKLGEAGALGNPAGLVHLCYGEEGRLRVHDVWATQEAFRDFADTLFPIIREVLGEPGTEHMISPVHSLLPERS